MVSRMDRYHSESANPIQSRSQKNEHLYENLYTNKILTEFRGIENSNVINLNETTSHDFPNKREDFQKNRRLFSENVDTRKILSMDMVEKVVDDPLERNYNINDILDEARKNRTTPDEIEKKRHLKTVEYNILSDLSQEKLREYHEKKQKLSKDEEENLEELIHTITSNSLRKKIDDELLSDLLPSEESETLISKQLLEDVNNSQTEKYNSSFAEEDTSEHKIDQSFYTKSMDLLEEDFDLEDDDETFLEDAKMSRAKKIFIIVFSIAVIGIIGYIIYRFV